MKRTDSYKGLTGDASPSAPPQPRTFGSFKKRREEQDRKAMNHAQLIAMQRRKALLEQAEDAQKKAVEAARARKLAEMTGDQANIIEEASYEESEDSFK